MLVYQRVITKQYKSHDSSKISMVDSSPIRTDSSSILATSSGWAWATLVVEPPENPQKFETTKQVMSKISYWLVVSTILKNISGRIILYIMENKTCSKPPTSIGGHWIQEKSWTYVEYLHMSHVIVGQILVVSNFTNQILSILSLSQPIYAGGYKSLMRSLWFFQCGCKWGCKPRIGCFDQIFLGPNMGLFVANHI